MRKKTMPIIPPSLQQQRPQSPLTLGQQRSQAKYESYARLSPAQKEAQQQTYVQAEINKEYNKVLNQLDASIASVNSSIANARQSYDNMQQQLQTERDPGARIGIVQSMRAFEREINDLQNKVQVYNSARGLPKEQLISNIGVIEANAAARYEESYRGHNNTSYTTPNQQGGVVLSASVYSAMQKAGNLDKVNVTGIFDPISGKTFANVGGYNQYQEAVQNRTIETGTLTRYNLPTIKSREQQLALEKREQESLKQTTGSVWGRDDNRGFVDRIQFQQQEAERLAQMQSVRNAEQEIFRPNPIFNINAKRQTTSYQPKLDKDLSIEAQYYKKVMQTELVEINKTERLISNEFNKIQKQFNNGDIDINTANRKLDEVQKSLADKYAEDSKARNEKIYNNLFKKEKELGWKPLTYDPYKVAQNYYGSKFAQSLPQWLRETTTKVGLAEVALFKGAYEGVRTQPSKTAASFAIGSATALVGIGLGSITGGAAIAPTLAVGGRILGGLYGASVVGRVAMTPGFAGKFETTGSILSTEVIPFAITGGIASYKTKVPKIEGLTEKETLRLYELNKAGGYRNPSITSEYASLRAKALNAMGKGAKEGEGLTPMQKEFNRVFEIKQYRGKDYDESTGIMFTKSRKIFPATQKLEIQKQQLAKKFEPYMKTFGEPVESKFVGFGKTFKGEKEIEIYAKKLLESGKLIEMNIKTPEQAINYVKENLQTRGYIVPTRLQKGGQGFKWNFKDIEGYNIDRAIEYRINTVDTGTKGEFMGFGNIYQKGITGKPIAQRSILQKFSMSQGKGEYLIFKKTGKIEIYQRGKITSSKQIKSPDGNMITRIYTSRMGEPKVRALGKKITPQIAEDFYNEPFAKKIGPQISKQKTIDITFYGDKTPTAKINAAQLKDINKELQIIESTGRTEQITSRFGITKVTPIENPFINLKMSKQQKTSKLPPSNPSINFNLPKQSTAKVLTTRSNQIQQPKSLLDLKQMLKPSISPKVTNLRTPRLTSDSKVNLGIGSMIGLNLLNLNKQQLKVNQINQLTLRQNLLIEKQFIEPTLDTTVKTTQQLKKDIVPQSQQITQQLQVPITITPTISPRITPGGTPFQFTPTKPTPKKPGRFGFLFPREAQQQSQQAYYPEVRIDATKNRKARWERVSEVPLTKESAISQAARVVDNTISAKGRVVPAPKKEVARDTGDKYFEINRRKFRGFQQKKGVRYKTPNQIIELQKYRADSPNELASLKKGRQEKRASMFGFR